MSVPIRKNSLVVEETMDKVILTDKHGHKFVWKMPNRGWYNFIFNNIQFEVRISKTQHGTTLLTFRDVESDTRIFQEPIQFVENRYT
jgi:hypothetical protein